ncbi:MAG TPA: UbiA-like polyprenyltransferase [Candidatus Paceibacterota bacterium]|nr:UbiA-like polyprenyltransferase [Candidatus Paceibacterota bacterium]
MATHAAIPMRPVIWMIQLLRRWGGFVRFSHTVFALPFAMASMAVAAREHRGWPGWRVFLLVLAAMVMARTCAMAFNRIMDREFDRANPRTAMRDLPAGRISLFSAWTLCVASGSAFIGVSYAINSVCFWLSPLALLIVCFYSLTKRFTDFTHFYLGAALALAPLGAWLAVRGRLDFEPVLLGIIVVCWLVGFDIIYAIQDYEFDRRHGLHSLVVRWGVQNALVFSFLVHMIMWGLLFALGLLLRFRVAYLSGLMLILACLVLEHWLARKRSLKWINVAFFRLNAVISVVFLIVVLAEVVFPGFRVVR